MVCKNIPVNGVYMEKSKGARLREERERLGLSQAVMGEIGGVKKLAQLKYEQDASSPSWGYLEAAARLGMDVLYIVTGKRIAGMLRDDEAELVTLYREAKNLQSATLRMLRGEEAHGSLVKPGKYDGAKIGAVHERGGTSVHQTFNGPVGSATPGDVSKGARKK